MSYVEDHQYLVGMFNGGKRHPVSWKTGWWVNEHQEHERVIEEGFRGMKTFWYPWRNVEFVFDLTKNKKYLLPLMKNKRCKPNTFYLVWRMPFGYEENAHFKICKTDRDGRLENRDSARWIELCDLITNHFLEV